VIARTPTRGFTLIELMVAVFVAAIVLSMGYGAVNQALESREALDARAERLQAVQTTIRLMTQDFTQLVPRPVRQPLGDGWLPALLSGTNTGSTLGGTTSTLSSTNPISSSSSSSSSSSGFGSSSSGFGSSSSGLGSTSSGLGASSSGLGSSSSGLGSSNSGLGSSSGGLGLGSANSSSGATSAFGLNSSLGSSQSGATTTSSASSTTSTSSTSSSGLNKGPVMLVTFTHTGWANPAGIQRPALQRVSYIIENGILRREHSPELDATMTTPTIRRELLDKVKSVTLRYMDVSFNWRDQWPPSALVGDPTANLRLRPIAVEVTLELEDWGTIVRVIEIAG